MLFRSSETINPYVDNQAPVIPTLNVSDSDNDGKINVSGIAEPKSTVTITWPDGTTSTAVADPVTGAYSVESPTVQESGDVKAKTTDINGKTSLEATNSYIDTQVPDAPTLNVSDIDGDGKIDVSGVAEPESTVTVTWPDGTISTVVTDPVSGAYSVESPTVQTNGDVKAKVTDINGNVSAETTNPYTSTTVVDEPTLNVTDSDNDGKINASGVAKPNSTVSVTWPDGTVSTAIADAQGKYIIESPTVQTSGDVKAKYTDTNGVVSGETINQYVDNQVPVIPTLNVTDSDNDGKINVSGIAEPGSTVTVTWPDGISTNVATDPVTGAYSAESPTVQGSGDVKVKVTDVNGNESAEVISPYVDTQVPDAPTLNVGDIDGDGKIDVSGVAEPKGIVTVTWPDGTTSTVVTDPVSGAYSVESPTVQPNGDVKAKVTDPDGKVSAETTNPYTSTTVVDEPTLNVTDSDNDGKINVSGVAKPNSTVSVTWPDGTVSTTVADAQGKYVIESPTVQTRDRKSVV